MTFPRLLLIIFAAFIAAGSASAAPVLVDPWQSSGNGTIKNDDFGTVPNMDLLFSGKAGFGAGADADRMYVYALWGTLFHVSYTTAQVGDVFLRPDAGWTEGVSLYSFDLGTYFGHTETNEVRIYNGDYSALLFQQVVDFAASAITFTPNLSSLNGLHIQFSGTPGYMAIDNIVVEAGQIFAASAVPVPGALTLLGLGLIGIGGMRRKKPAA